MHLLWPHYTVFFYWLSKQFSSSLQGNDTPLILTLVSSRGPGNKEIGYGKSIWKEKRNQCGSSRRSATSQRQNKSWSEGWKVTVWSPGVENRSGLGSWTARVEAGGKDMGGGQPAEGSRQLPTACLCKPRHSCHGDAATYKWAETGKEVRGCYERFVGLCRSLPVFYYNVYCPLYCSCAAPETSPLNNFLVAGQDTTCSGVLSGNR